ncbi:penicillin acylase family protein [Nocardioides sp. YIM 152588]|uniref:penicillin acylase family protein n=1 Tax=Nocardioides sp. YIM 152588 TaxID=3158259 RepID=UPI0032E370F0
MESGTDAGQGRTSTTPRGSAGPTRGGFRGLPPSLRWTVYGVVGLVVVLVAATLTGVGIARSSWPQTAGALRLDGLDAEVEVLRDGHGIPQIYADTTHDLMFAQGYVHAQDRFFEMDVRRHATAGRLAELLGESALEGDLVVRTLGWRRVAARELTMLRPATRAALDAYAEGVNAYLAERSLADLSLEYALLDLAGLDYRPARWTAVDSIAWLKAMAWDLRANVDDEAARAVSVALVGSDRAADLYPPYDAEAHPPIVRQGAVVDGVFDPGADATSSTLRPPPGPGVTAALAAAADVLAAAPTLLGDGDGIGSNAWVVDGDHTSTGAPILANDPHLGVSLPGAWSQVGLHCRSVGAECPFDVAGFGFAGVPGVVIGHNADIAWGLTNLGADVSDLYVERIDGDHWRYGDRRRRLRTRVERIKVRGGDPVDLTVRATRHGPLLSDLVALDRVSERIDLTEGGLLSAATAAGAVAAGSGARWSTGVSLAWTALRPRPTADALYDLNVAGDFASFRAALEDFAVPGQNVLYADTDGHIGYQAAGEIPLRAPGHDGSTPVAGWRPANDWAGRVPAAAMPWVLDPPSGMIVAANQQPVDPDRYPYPLGEDWDRGYRAARIERLLADAVPDLGVAAVRRVQLDDLNPLAQVLRPYLLGVRLPEGYYAEGQDLLLGWDGRQPADSAAAAYFNAAWRQLLRATFDDELPVGLRPDGGSRWFDVVAGLLTRRHDPWWDDVTTQDVVEDRNDILVAAQLAARDELTALLSPDPGEWSWGRLHELELRSPTLGESGIGAVERIFNRGGWEAAGGGSVVDATGWDATEGYDVTSAPSMRMIVPLDDLDAARWISLTGVSGHAFHPHYTDQTDLWARGEDLAWPFSEGDVVRATDETLVLRPAD